MNSVVHESTQQMLLPGRCTDLYYPDPETAEKQCFRTTVNSKFVVQFASLTGGTNVLTVPPNMGVQDILLVLRLPDISGANTGLALPQGWGYSLIRQISYRVGGSSQYFVTGLQNFQNCMRLAPNASARDALFALGGAQISNATAWGANFSALRTAYVWLSLPWTKPTADGKPPPLPTDLLTQQLQITVETYSLASIFCVSGVSPSTPPVQLDSAEFQVQQVQLNNAGDMLARRVDMTTHSLSYPCEFTQQEVQFPIQGASALIGSSAQPVTISLTGFRSGEVKNLQMWLTLNSQAIGNGSGIQNPLAYYAPENVVVTYAGDQYSRFDAGSSKAWNLINGVQTPTASGLTLSFGGGAYTGTASAYSWVEAPFAQAYRPVTAHSMYVAGKEITNGIVQVQFTIPQLAPGVSAAGPWTFHCSYIYNSVLVFSQGTADFAF